MGSRPTFTLPEGLKLDLTAERITIEYDGDVEIEVDLGKRIGGIKAGGDLTIKAPPPPATFAVSGDLIAGGVLKLQGDVVDGGRLQGREVLLGRQTVRCRSITATERIVVGPGTVTCDVMMAPEITIDPKAQGRITVVECQNERGASKIKGCLSLADYEDMIGNSRDFLAQLGLTPLPGRPLNPEQITTRPGGTDRIVAPRGELVHGSTLHGNSPSPHTPLAHAPVAQGVHVQAPGNVPATPTPTTRAEVPGRRVEPPPVARAAPNKKKRTDEEDVDDPLSLSLDDLEPLVEPSEASTEADEHDLQQRLNDALGRITACYEGTDLPPAVDELRSLVEHRDYDGLRQNITEVWNGLLGFHQKRGIRPHHQVTHAFNVIHGLVST